MSEKLLGIEIFEWNGWDEVEEQVLIFYDVKFKFNSLKKYDGYAISVGRDWQIEAIDENANVTKINLLEVPEFVEEIKKQLNIKD